MERDFDTFGKTNFPRRIEYDSVDYSDLDDYTRNDGPTQLDEEDHFNFWNRQEDWKNLRKKEFIVRPNPPPFIRLETQVTEVEGEDVASKKDNGKHRRGKSI